MIIEEVSLGLAHIVKLDEVAQFLVSLFEWERQNAAHFTIPPQLGAAAETSEKIFAIKTLTEEILYLLDLLIEIISSRKESVPFQIWAKFLVKLWLV